MLTAYFQKGTAIHFCSIKLSYMRSTALFKYQHAIKLYFQTYDQIKTAGKAAC